MSGVPGLIHQLFARQAAARPDATALVDDDGTTTYAELEEETARLAGVLADRGVRRGDCVGVLAERSSRMVAAILAVLKAGAAYTMLDPQSPDQRLRDMAADARITAVVTTGGAATALPVGLTVPTVSWADAAAGPTPGTFREPVGHPGDVACVMFTSGSTGRPKGVVTSHRALVHTITGQEYLSFRPGAVWLQSSPVFWDAFALELWGPLLSGGVCVLHPAGRPDPALISGLVAERGVTTGYLSAGLFNVLVDEYPQALDGFTELAVGGEPLSPAHVRRALDRCPDLRLRNGYGPVEATVFTTWHPLTAADAAGDSVPIGRPLAGRRVYVLDARLRPVADGAEGELYVAGSGLALGYAGRPELTAERFVADPFGPPGGRMYRTGDLVRRCSEGVLEYGGRADDQVKIRGFRVEPREVETVLARHPSVARLVVVAREDRPGDVRLVAYAVLRESEHDLDPLRAYARSALPDFMVPSDFVPLDAIPLTANGKTDRRALPAPAAPSVEHHSGHGPWTAREEVLCALFAEILGRRLIGPDDDFFHLGGDSLRAARLVARVNRALGVRLTTRSLFEAPTARALARRASTAAGNSRAAARPTPRPVGRDDVLPLSEGQKGLLLHDSVSDSPAYNIPVLVQIRGAVDARALRDALGDVAGRHEALRTTFPSVGGERVQLVLSGETARPVLDTVRVTAEDLNRAVAEVARHRFRLTAETGLRAALFDITDTEEHALLLVIHHVAFDAWSIRLLLRDLATAYAARLRDEPPAWQPLPVQYGDFALWQREVLRGDTTADALAYWQRELKGLPDELSLPRRLDRQAALDSRSHAVRRRLDARSHSRLLQLARDHDGTLFTVLCTALAVTLGRMGGGEDVPLGVPVSARGDENLDDLVGFFADTLVLRTDLSGDPTVGQLIARVREAYLAADDHRVPFGRLVEAVAPARVPGRHPLFQTMLAVRTDDRTTLELPGAESRVELLSTGHARFDLVVDVTDAYGPDGEPDGVELTVEYRTAVFDRETVETVADSLVQALMAMTVAPPKTPVAALDLVPAAHRRDILRAGTCPPPEGGDIPVHLLVARHAAETPEAPAVVCGSTVLSYRELTARARRLAARLRAAGAGPETPVGVLLPRSADMATAVLAVHWAGAAYLPLDPAHPAERIRHMLADSGTRLVVGAEQTVAGLSGVDGAQILLYEGAADGTGMTDAPFDASFDDGPDGSPAGELPDLAYLIYTSGSTGRPKGVAVEHRSLANLVRAQRDAFGVTAGDRVLQYASLGFDASVSELYVTWAAGAALHIATENERLGEPLLKRLAQDRITSVTLPPSVLATLPGGPEALPGLRTLVVAGEPCPAATVRRWAPGRRFIDAYGPTEATVCGTLNELGPTDPPLIGRPLAGVRVYVLDDRLRPVPPGAPGEIYLGGRAPARGYVRRPGLTAERFVADPYASEPGSRMYRTGDIGRFRAGGALEYLGRLDGQFKIRGVRIEPGEVETVLADHEAVAHAVVTVDEDAGGDVRLVAYVLPYEGLRPDPAALRAHAATVLPPALVPASFTLLQALPLTANGKVDRTALPKPAPDRADSGAEYVAPGTVLEHRLTDLWAKVLGLEQVGVCDDFFALGGTSLLAVRAAAQIQGSEQLPVTAADFFRAPTIEALARKLTAARAASGHGTVRSRAAERIPRRPRENADSA